LITVDGAATEAEFFRGPDGAHWERPYGWAWLLVLDAELRRWAARDPATAAAGWAKNLSPLTEILRDRCLTWVTEAARPTRVGTHGNSAFSLGLILDAAGRARTTNWPTRSPPPPAVGSAMTGLTAPTNRTRPTSSPPRWSRPT